MNIHEVDRSFQTVWQAVTVKLHNSVGRLLNPLSMWLIGNRLQDEEEIRYSVWTVQIKASAEI